MKVRGVLLANSKSSKFAPYFPQIGAVKIAVDGSVKTVVEHHVDRLLPFVERLYVVVHEFKNVYGDVLKRLSMNEKIRVVDIEDLGEAYVWKTLMNKLGNSFFLSVDCSVIHDATAYEEMIDLREPCISVMWTRDIEVLRSSVQYIMGCRTSRMLVLDVLNIGRGFEKGYVGTGACVLRRKDLSRCCLKEKYGIGDVIKQLIDMDIDVYAIEEEKNLFIDKELLLKLRS